MKKIFGGQYKLARLALVALSSCPKVYLEYELDFQPMELVCKQALVRHYETYKRAPETSLKSVVFEKWLKFRDVNTAEQDKLVVGQLNSFNKSVLSRALQIKRVYSGFDFDEFSNWSKIEM